MISFFRKIRKNLLNEGKTARYLKYALGEILLVVIGILIALQINDWNSLRHEREREQTILKSLKISFTDNLNDLVKTKNDTKIAYETTLKLLEFIHPTEVKYTTEVIDQMMGNLINFYTFDPATGVIDEVINSGKLSIIQNGELKKQLSNWSRLESDTNKDVVIATDHLFKFMIVYFSEHVNLKNIPVPVKILNPAKLRQIPESNFSQDYSQLMSSMEFESLIYWHAINMVYVVSEYEKFETYLKTTIALLDSEIK